MASFRYVHFGPTVAMEAVHHWVLALLHQAGIANQVLPQIYRHIWPDGDTRPSMDFWQMVTGVWTCWWDCFFLSKSGWDCERQGKTSSSTLFSFSLGLREGQQQTNAEMQGKVKNSWPIVPSEIKVARIRYTTPWPKEIHSAAWCACEFFYI
jgi:hypothetical protein